MASGSRTSQRAIILLLVVLFVATDNEPAKYRPLALGLIVLYIVICILQYLSFVGPW